ncbi:glycosyl hydrolase, family 25 [Oceaniovalibus guishaninsula JLT2003]|uniref:Glycosyl hydrolase, family 25 n=1 Tax=Oceaniovalibus guishaninsula JLT2003 TaxID=1231392 RepID=K2HBI0_9RHOB|nr:GH25 family lysozyme [Oceaniovalibus guishaninsula]EKE43977.1 glycosyl hydrolase, family 25 [Oceaniovalibus guishaninsula JLT2003]
MRAMLILFLLLAACARPAPPVPGQMQVVPPAFGDSRPHDWPGRGPAAYGVHGIDVSRWQAAPDWNAARAAGVNFAFLKATEGGDRLDPAFGSHSEGAARAGIPVGAYHFFYFCTPAEDQARWFIANVPRRAGNLPPVLDLEWNPHSPTCTFRPDPAVVRAEARTWLDIVGRHYGQRPIVYTTPDFWDRNDIGQLDAEFWLRSTAATPADRYPGARWTFWQYTATGTVPGFSGGTDINAFVGSASAWHDWRIRRSLR